MSRDGLSGRGWYRVLDAVCRVIGLYAHRLVVRRRGHVGGAVLHDIAVGMAVVTEFDVGEDRVDHVHVGSVHRFTAAMGQVRSGQDVPSLEEEEEEERSKLLHLT